MMQEQGARGNVTHSAHHFFTSTLCHHLANNNDVLVMTAMTVSGITQHELSGTWLTLS